MDGHYFTAASMFTCLDDEGEEGEIREPSEDEYDALNDETFGVEQFDAMDDWEQAHEQMAQITETKRCKHLDESHDVEASLSQMVLEDNGDSKLHRHNDLFARALAARAATAPSPRPWLQPTKPNTASAQMPGLTNVCTVEEIERQMRQQTVTQQHQQPSQSQGFFPPRFPLILQRPSNIQQQQNHIPPFHNAPPPTQQLMPPQNQQLLTQNQQLMSQNLLLSQKQQQNQALIQQNQNMMTHNQTMLQQTQGLKQMMTQNQGQMQQNPQHMNQMHQNQPNMMQNGGQQMQPNNMPFGINNNFIQQFNQYHQHSMSNNNAGANQFGQIRGPMMPPGGPTGIRPNFNYGPPPTNQQPPGYQAGVRPPQMTPDIQNQLKKAHDKLKLQQNRMNFQPNAAPPRPMTSQPLTSQSLIQMIQNNHPMLNNGYGANHHPMLNNSRTAGGFNRSFQSTNSGELDDYDDFLEDNKNKDEYAGLMSSREKQWLLNIQMLQLCTGTPYIHDYYYTVFTDRKRQQEKEDVKEAHAANQKNHPFYSGGENEKRQRERHNSGRLSNVEETPPRTYVPTQFENSLGKLQSSSVTAPRKIIDVELISGESNPMQCTGRVSRAASVTSTANETPRESRRTKTLLLDIEALYCVLLRLEELRKPLAIADALVLKEREEKQRQLEAAMKELENTVNEIKSDNLFLKNIESLHRHTKGRDSPPLDKRQVVSVAPAGPQTVVAKNLLDENKDELICKMFNGLLYEDKLKQILAVRKGRALLLRFLKCLEHEQSTQMILSRLRSLWPQCLRSLHRVARKSDILLDQLYPAFRRYVRHSNGWSTILECSFALNQALDPARPPLALNAPLTLSCVCALLSKADTLIQSNEGSASERNWTKFLKNLARTLKNCKTAIAPPIEPLNTNLVSNHVRILESRGTVEILKRGTLKSEFADLGKTDFSNMLLKHLC